MEGLVGDRERCVEQRIFQCSENVSLSAGNKREGVRFAEGGMKQAKLVRQEKFLKASEVDVLSSRRRQCQLIGDVRLMEDLWQELMVGRCVRNNEEGGGGGQGRGGGSSP